MTRVRFCIATFALLVICASAHAELRPVAWWRMGEDDAKAAAGQPVKEVADSSPDKHPLKPLGEPIYSDSVSDKAPISKLSVTFGDKAQGLQRTGLATLKDNFVVEAFVRPTTDDGFRVIVQYGSAAHGWSLIRNGKGYQVLLGGVALVGWSGDSASGTWAHVAMARVDGVTKFYFNGKEAGTSNAGLNQADDKAKLTIGADDQAKSLFGGEIDEVRISTFPAGGFTPDMLMVNDPDGKNAKKQAAAPPAAKPGAPAAPGDEQASILFDVDPAMKKMTFNRGSLSAQPAQGDSPACWTAQQNSAADVPWARSVLITLTDPAMREGRSPVVDIEVEYRQTFNAPIELRADTSAGSRVVGGGWGNNPGWQKFTARIDDAYFGARQFGHPNSEFQTDGYDLRINSFGGDFSIRSIKLKTYDLGDHPNYKRLIRFDKIETENDLFLFAPGQPAKFSYVFSNLATKPVTLTYRHTVIDRSGKVRAEASEPYTMDGRAAAPLAVSIDTKDLLLGSYTTRLQLLSPTKEVIFERRGGFAVAEESPVERAKPGDFLYGLDIKLGPAYDSPRLLRWAKFMGADIIRHGFGWEDKIDEITNKLAVYENAGLQVMLMCDPPKTLDAGERAAQLERKVQYLEAVAKQFPQIKFYELGNEPDLTFFYPGPIEQYAADYQVMSTALKRGNPDAVVLNGGLCFAGADAVNRATKFIEVINPDSLGAWAYHGHGPGMKAESSALNRIRDLARAAGKVKPFADTETGVAAQTPEQEQVQARTVVQKMVYAQHQKSPFLMFFRLLMFEENYGMLYSEQEPRPSVLSYATLVRQLRGLRYQFDLSDLPAGVNGFVFASDDGSRHSAVLWADSTATEQLRLKLNAPAGVKQVDLYGNSTPVQLAGDASLAVAVGADPIYLNWSDKSASTLAVIPSALDLPSEIAVRSAGPDVLPVTITSHDRQPIAGTLHLTPGQQSGIEFAKNDLPVNVPVGESVVVSVPINVLSLDGATLTWPRQWTVFVGADLKEADSKAMTAIPISLNGAKGAVKARPVVLQNDRIDFESLGGTMREHEPAVVMANIHSKVDQSVTVGASADWWMEWIVNGKTAYSTMDRGNGGGYAISDHTFSLPLKKGDNLVVVRVKSGSMGWKLLIGSPSRLNELSADVATLGVKLDLNEPGKTPQSRTIGIRRVSPIEAWSPDNTSSKLADWNSVQPDLVLLDHVDNHFAKMPDATKWWKGAKDLSARGWVRVKGNKLIVALAVEDDQHRPADGAIDQGDGVRLRLAGADSKPIDIDVVAKADGTAACTASGESVKAKGRFERVEGTSFYQVELSFADQKPGYLDAILFDQDDVPAKQQLSFAPASGGALQGWYRLVWPQ